MASKQLEFDAVVSAGQLNKLLTDLKAGAEGAAQSINNALGGTVTKKLVIQSSIDEKGQRQYLAVEKERLSVADQIVNTIRKESQVQRGSVTSLRQQVNEARQARDAIAKIEKSVDQYGRKISSVNPAWVQQNKEVARLSRELDIASASGFWQQAKTGLNAQGLINFSNGLNQVVQGFQAASIVVGQFSSAINTVISNAANLQQFELAFKAIGAGSSGAISSLSEVSRIALGLGVSIQTVQDSFQQLSPVVLNTGGTLEDVSAISEALASRFAAFGISGDRARRVMNGIIQAFAKGKLQAEELTQQISEADPAFKTDLAGAIGVSVQELEKLVKAGDITSEKLIEIIPRLTKSSLLFGKLGSSAASAVQALREGAVTIDQVRTNFQNLNQVSLRNLISVADPLINAFLAAQGAIVDFFSRITQLSSTATLSNLLAKIAESVKRLVDVFLTAAEGVLRFVDAISPFINAILKIPGVIEFAGLAILGKFLKPLELLSKGLQPIAAAASAAAAGFTSAWKGAESPVDNLRQSLAAFRKEVSTKAVAAPVNIVGETSSIATERRQVISASEEAIRKEYQKTYQRLVSFEKKKGIQRGTDATGGAISVQALRDAERELASISSRTEEARIKAESLSAASRRLAPGFDRASSSAGNLSQNISIALGLLDKGVESGEQWLRRLTKKQAASFVLKDPAGLIDFIRSNPERGFKLLDEAIEGADERLSSLSQSGIKTGQSFDAANQQLKTLQDIKTRLQSGAPLDLSADADRAVSDYQALAKQQKAAAAEVENLKSKLSAAPTGVTLSEKQARKYGELQANVSRAREAVLKLNAATTGPVTPPPVSGYFQLEAAYKKAASSSSTFADRQRFLSLSLNQGRQSLASYRQEFQALATRLQSLSRGRDFLQGRLSAAPVGSEQTAGIRQQLQSVQQSFARLTPRYFELIELQGKARGEIDRLKGAMADNVKITAQAAAQNTALGRAQQFLGASARVAIAPFRGIASIFTSAAKGAAGLIAGLGPIGIAFLVAGAASRLYADGNKSATEATKDLQEQAKVLRATLKDLGETSAVPDGPKSSTARLYDRLTFAAVQIGDSFASGLGAISDFFDSIVKGAENGVKSLGGLGDAIGTVSQLLLTAGGAALGAKLGALVGGLPGAAIGAALGGTATALLSVALATDDATVAIKNYRRGATAAVQEVKNLLPLAEKLVDVLGQRIETQGADIGLDTSFGAGLETLSDTIEKIEAKIEEFENSSASAGQKLAELGDESIRTANKIARLEQIERSRKLTAGEESLLKDSRERLKTIKDEQLVLERIQSISGQSADKLRGDAANLTAEYDRLAAATGRVTSAQEGQLLSLAEQQQEYKELKDSLSTFNLDTTAGFANFNKALVQAAQLSVEIQRTEDLIKEIESIEIAAEIDSRITNGQINNSIENIGRTIQALEGASTVLDIDDPTLPDVLQRLEAARQKTDELNGRRAQILIEIFEKGGFQNTLANLDRFAAALQQKLQGTDLLSAEGNTLLAQIQKQQVFRDAATRTSAELERSLQEDNLQERLKGLQTQKEAESAVLNRRKEALQQELQRVQEIANARIESLRALTPAEQKLAALRREDLQEQAKKGGREGLEAQAQLERLATEEEIAEIQRKAAAEQAAIQRKIAALDAEDKKRQEEYRKRELAIQEELLSLAKQEREEKQAAAQAVLDARRNGAGLGTDAIDAATIAQDQYTQSVVGSAEAIQSLNTNLQTARENSSSISSAVALLGETLPQAADAAATIGSGLREGGEGVALLGQSISGAKDALTGGAEAAQKFKDSFEGAAKAADPLAEESAGISKSAGEAAAGTTTMAEQMSNAVIPSASIRANLEAAAKAAKSIRLSGGTQSRFTGGPVTGGSAYTVNEFGKELFLSAAGKLSPINARPWSTWRAPSSGTVIPAHIASAIDVPRNGVNVSRSNASAIDRAVSGSGLTGRMLGRLITAVNSQVNPTAQRNMAAIQSAQAVQLGKLTHAVDKLSEKMEELSDKEWGVQVNLRGSGDGMSYTRALSRRI